MKNKVLSYHRLNSRKSSMLADYLHFPSNKNTNFFLAFYSKNFDDNKASQYPHTLFCHTMLDWKLLLSNSHVMSIFLVPGVRLKVVISHTMSYFCGSWWRTFLLFTAQPRNINFFTTPSLLSCCSSVYSVCSSV